jgi:hypothetical protein
MHLLSRFSLIATVSKHDVAGIVIAVVAVALLGGAAVKLATKAVRGILTLLLLGVLAAVVAVLLFTRVI